MKPALSRGEIQLIGATTIEEYRKHIEKDAALERRFQPVMVEEPAKEEAEEILRGLVPYYEKHHGVAIEESAVKAAVAMGIRYINDRFLPDKALDLLDEACSKVQLDGYKTPDGLVEMEKHLRSLYQEKGSGEQQDFVLAKQLQQEQKETEEQLEKARERFEKQCKRKRLVVTEDQVAQVVAEWTKIPVKKLTEGESKRLARLETILHKRVIGQEEAVRAVAKAVKRGRVRFKRSKTSHWFFPPSGTYGCGKDRTFQSTGGSGFRQRRRYDSCGHVRIHGKTQCVQTDRFSSGICRV